MELLKIEDLKLDIENSNQNIHILHDINLVINGRDILGLVGESGSGKTMTMRTVIQLLPKKAKIISGKVIYQNQNLLEKTEKEMENIRGREISIIFQDATSALNPVYSIGKQISDIYLRHKGRDKKKALEETVDILRRVAFPKPSESVKAFPHELSGGMCQRVIIAMALMCSPKLLIADEPTTGLDVTIQNQVIDLILDVTKEIGAALVFISHDIGMVAKACYKIAVMYAGHIVEVGTTQMILEKPLHPYTKGLVRCYKTILGKRMAYIRGSAPELIKTISGCPFEPRCDVAMDICKRQKPKSIQFEKEHWVTCHKWDN